MKRSNTPKKPESTVNASARFKVGDRVRVRDLPNMFYTRAQMYARGVEGTIAACTYQAELGENLTRPADYPAPVVGCSVPFR